MAHGVVSAAMWPNSNNASYHHINDSSATAGTADRRIARVEIFYHHPALGRSLFPWAHPDSHLIERSRSLW